MKSFTRLEKILIAWLFVSIAFDVLNLCKDFVVLK